MNRNSLTAKIVFVDFPADTVTGEPAIPFDSLPLIDPPEGVEGFCEQFERFFNEQSPQEVTLDVEVIKNGTSNVWTMPKPYSYYRDFDEDNDDYAMWEDYVFPGSTGSTVVNAQVLLDILNHLDHGVDNSPFSDGSSCWFVHSYNDVDGWEGQARTNIYPSAYPDSFIPGQVLIGFTTHLGDWDDGDQEIDWRTWNQMRFIMAHEYGHNLGLPHLELWNYDPSVNYGAYGLMRGSVLTPSNNDSMYENDGFISLHPRSLSTLGWIDVETVESAKKFDLTNLRSEGGYAIEIPAS